MSFRAIFLITLISIIMTFGVLSTINGNSDNYINRLLEVIYYNPLFWIILILPILISLYFKFKYHKNFLWTEWVIQIIISSFAVIIIFTIFYSKSTNLKDISIYNSYIKKAEYYEEWTELTKEDGKLKSKHHPPSWKLTTDIGEVLNITRYEYNYITVLFKNKEKIFLNRKSQTSIGDGNKYITYAKDIIYPTAIEHTVINYIKASKKTLFKEELKINEIDKKYLINYPKVYNGKYGKIEFNRVIDPLNLIDEDIEFDKLLDMIATLYGAKREVNPLVYILSSDLNIDFIPKIESFWSGFKKNDLIIFLFLNDKNIERVAIEALSDNELFKIELRDEILKLQEFNIKKIVKILNEKLSIESENGNGFKRKSMQDFKYLMHSVSLPWYINLIIIVLATLINTLLATYMIKNRYNSK